MDCFNLIDYMGQATDIVHEHSFDNGVFSGEVYCLENHKL